VATGASTAEKKGKVRGREEGREGGREGEVIRSFFFKTFKNARFLVFSPFSLPPSLPLHLPT
jgi:hypothetical protein